MSGITKDAVRDAVEAAFYTKTGKEEFDALYAEVDPPPVRYWYRTEDEEEAAELAAAPEVARRSAAIEAYTSAVLATSEAVAEALAGVGVPAAAGGQTPYGHVVAGMVGDEPVLVNGFFSDLDRYFPVSAITFRWTDLAWEALTGGDED